MLSYSKKKLKVVIKLGQSCFEEISKDSNTVTIENNRVVLSIEKAGGVQMSILHAKIYGLSLNSMNRILTLQWKPNETVKNSIDIYTVISGTESLIFSGDIINAWSDFQSIPDAFLYVHAMAAYHAQLAPATPLSIKGDVKVADLFSKIANSLGIGFENSGVTTTCKNPYYCNGNVAQAKDLAKCYGICMGIDDKTLFITPSYYSPRQGDPVKLSPSTGLIGYPSVDGIGIRLMSLFRPDLRMQGKIEVQSDFKLACGTWVISSISYSLESEIPDSNWLCRIIALPVGILSG